jgi:tRNA dimethylallyltransferase
MLADHRVVTNTPADYPRFMQFSIEILNRCWFLAGPTACGKTAAGLLLAEQLSAEIISLDSMAIYRGMDIGTAKPDRSEQARVPHHMIDVVDPHEEFSVAEFVAAAHRICGDILNRGRIPLFVGGTGLYLRAVLRGVFEGPAADWELRKELEKFEKEQGRGALYRRLEQVDPTAAARLHPNDLRRTIRALEVRELTGKPLSAQQQQGALAAEQRPANVYWLSPPRDWLHDRINLRVERMIDAGLVEEVRGLLEMQPPMADTARQALGYKEIIEHLERRTTLPEAIETLQTRTRQFAKRQHTWFRNLEECHAVEINGAESAHELVKRITQHKKN